MSKLLMVLLLALTIPVHAGSNARGPHGGIGAARNAGAHASVAGAQSGRSGGRYEPNGESLVDGYQPWPESSMRQFQKLHWAPYTGE